MHRADIFCPHRLIKSSCHYQLDLCLQQLRTVDEGTELELVEATLEGKTKLNATPYPILSIYADEQEKLYMALFI